MRRYSRQGHLTLRLERIEGATRTTQRTRSSTRRLRDKLSRADHDSIVRDRRENRDSLAVLAKRYGVSDYSIRMILARAGVAVGSPRMSEGKREQVQQWHRDGVSNMEIARRTGLAESAVALTVAALSR